MMSTTLKFLFNALRNLSLLVVLSVGATFLAKKYFQQGADIELSANTSLAQERDVSTFWLFGDVEPPARDEKSGLPPVRPSTGRMEIKVPGGAAYLAPGDIAYVNAGPKLQIVTTANDTIEASLRLHELEKMLKSSWFYTFFRIRTAIINCAHIQQLVKRDVHPERGRYHYQHYIIMNDGTEIPISEPRAEALVSIMRGQ